MCEEFFKGLFILGLFWLRQDEFDGVGGLPYFAAAYVLIFLPTFVGLAFLARYSIRKEGELVRAQLLNDVNAGYLAPADYYSICSPAARRADIRAARARGGRALAAAKKAFHQAATELAFYRFRVARGIKQPDPLLEAEHFHTLNEIQKRIAALTM